MKTNWRDGKHDISTDQSKTGTDTFLLSISLVQGSELKITPKGICGAAL